MPGNDKISFLERQVHGMRSLLFGMLVALCVVCTARSEEQLNVGMIAPTSIVAEFVTGDLAKRGSACPVLTNRGSVKIAVFIKRLDDQVLPLISAIEGLVAQDAALKHSFVFLSHENAPTPSQDDWDDQLAHLKKLASERDIKHLSIGVMLRNPDNVKPTRAKRHLGFFENGDVVVMLIRPDAKVKRGCIQYVSLLKSEEIEMKTVELIRNQLVHAIAAVKLP
jgi:hypothetical protein